MNNCVIHRQAKTQYTQLYSTLDSDSPFNFINQIGAYHHFHCSYTVLVKPAIPHLYNNYKDIYIKLQQYACKLVLDFDYLDFLCLHFVVGNEITCLIFSVFNLSQQTISNILEPMSKKDMTLVYYYVPEDKDDSDCPNVFGVPQSKANIRLSHIHQLFPLKGSYIYRFKHNHEGTPVWLDLPDLQSKLPTYKDRIIIKATRVQWSDFKLHSQYKEKQATHSQIPKKVEEVNVFEASIPTQHAKPVQVKQHQQPNLNNIHNLLDQKTTHVHTSPKMNYSDFNLFEGVSHNNTNFGHLQGGQKSHSIDLIQEFKHGDLI